MRTSLLLICLFMAAHAFAWPWQNNERLYFEVKYAGVVAGEASLNADPVDHEGTGAFKFYTIARTKPFFDTFFTVRDKIESVWDSTAQVSLKLTKRLQEGGYRQFRVQYYYPQQDTSLYLKWRFKQQDFNQKRFAIEPNTQDVLAAFYMCRNSNFDVGDQLNFNVSVDGVNYPLVVKVLRREKIKSVFGKRTCLVVEPLLKGVGLFKQEGRIEIWLTDDEYKIPLQLRSKVSIGSFWAVLSGAENVPYRIVND